MFPNRLQIRRLNGTGDQFVPGLAGVNVRINHVAPNFRFEYAPGRDLTLNKLSGWKELVFWRSSSEPSIQAVLDAQNVHRACVVRSRSPL